MPFRTPWARRVIRVELRAKLYRLAQQHLAEKGEAGDGAADLFQRRNPLQVAVIHLVRDEIELPNYRAVDALSRLGEAVAAGTFKAKPSHYPDIRQIMADNAVPQARHRTRDGFEFVDISTVRAPADRAAIQPAEPLQIEATSPVMTINGVSPDGLPGTVVLMEGEGVTIRQGNGSMLIIGDIPPEDRTRGVTPFMDPALGEQFDAEVSAAAGEEEDRRFIDAVNRIVGEPNRNGDVFPPATTENAGQITREMMAEAAAALPRAEAARIARRARQLGHTERDTANRALFERMTVPNVSHGPLTPQQLYAHIAKHVDYFLDVAMPWPAGHRELRMPPVDADRIRGVSADMVWLDEASDFSADEFAEAIGGFTRAVVREESFARRILPAVLVVEPPEELMIRCDLIRIEEEFHVPRTIGISFGRDFILMGDDPDTRYWIRSVLWNSGTAQGDTGEIHVSRILPEDQAFVVRSVQEIGRYRDSRVWRPIFRANR